MTGSTFDGDALLGELESRDLQSTDDLSFGLITMDRSGQVLWYNHHEATSTGFDAASVVGQPFFESVGPCMNNYLVAQRFADEPDLDEFVDYIFTIKLAPTPVRLRLLAKAGSERQYLAVQFL